MSKQSTATPLQRLNKTLWGSGNQPEGKMPATVTGPLGTVPGAAIDTSAPTPAPRQLSAKQAEHVMWAELIGAVRSLYESSTELAARLGRRGASNGVLDVRGIIIPASGVVTGSYEVTAGSLVIDNLSAANTITVQSGVAAGDTGPQGAGTGVQYVGPGKRLIMPLNDRAWTLSGTAADKVNLQAFTGLQPFGVSAL